MRKILLFASALATLAVACCTYDLFDLQPPVLENSGDDNGGGSDTPGSNVGQSSYN